MIFCETKRIFTEPDTDLAVREMVIFLSKTMFSGTKKIVTVAVKIIYGVEKPVSLTNLILDAAQKIGSKSSRIADEPQIMLDQT